MADLPGQTPRHSTDDINASLGIATLTADALAVELADPVALFNHNYQANSGNLLSFTPSSLPPPNATIRSNVRRLPSSTPLSSPRRKRHASAAVIGSPMRRSAIAVASIVATVATNRYMPPPAVTQDDPSPTSVVAAAFEPPAAADKPPPKKGKGANITMIGHIPKSEMLRWPREQSHYKTKVKINETTIKADLKKKRSWMLKHFKWHDNQHVDQGEVSSDGRVLRSQEEDIDDWVLDSDSFNVETTNERRLSRYCMEQIWIQKDKAKLLLLVQVDHDDELFGGLGAKIDSVQSVDRASISGRQYYRLKLTITDSNYNNLVHGKASKMYSETDFSNDFWNNKGDFEVTFDGTNIIHRFRWREILENPTTFLFFGPPLTQSRSFDAAFRDCTSGTLHHRFCCFYDEFEGDIVACNALYNSYLSKKLAIVEKDARRYKKKLDGYDGSLFRKKKVVQFLEDFDNHCFERVQSVFTEFKNHSEPIISTPDMETFLSQAPEVFGQAWDYLCELRGVEANQPSKEARNKPKIHSVFFQLLSIARTSNRQRLKHWGFLSSVANFARGVATSAETAFAYSGLSVSPTTRLRIMARITGNDKEGELKNDTLRHKHSKLLRASSAVIIAFDNYQKGLKLKNQRGGHSSAFFKGTHQCAHQAIVFDDVSFDEEYADFTLLDQAIPSPWGMAAFEFLDLSDPTYFFLNYDTYVTDTTPEFSGKRVSSYVELKNICSYIKKFGRAFVVSDKDEDYFDQCPDEFDRARLSAFTTRCNSNDGRKLFSSAKSFQQNTVMKWNPDVGKQTLSVYLGLLGIDESASKECGAITLDLLLKAGVLVEGKDGDWILADNWDQRRIYLFGDAKTVENVAKFVRDMQDRKISYTTANLQADIFVKALKSIIHVPGDWHTGLNMLTSIYNLYYVGFLDKFQELLGWKRINQDVRSCYYQAKTLVEFVSEEMHRFFIHKFVAGRAVSDDEKDMSDPRVVCKFTIEFMNYMNEQKSSEDKWVATCANFLEMSFDFLEFVEAYRLGDSVIIEHGYQKYAPIWQALGQNKYVEIFYSQQESLYRDHPFSFLQELRLNRVVRRYLLEAGKRCVAQDEFLEHGNKFYSLFPTPKTLKAFEFQSHYVGVGLMCKRFTDLWFSTTWNGDKPRDYKNSVPSKRTVERRLLYEVIGLLKTHVPDAARTSFNKSYIMTIKDDISVKLRNEVLEHSINDNANSSADEILKSLNSLFGGGDTVAGIDPAEEAEDGEEVEVDAADIEIEVLPFEREERETPGKKKVMHKYISEDVWEIGREEFKKNDVLEARKEAVVRRNLRSDIRECIISSILDKVARDDMVVVGKEVAGRPSWQRMVRTRKNNLGLK